MSLLPSPKENPGTLPSAGSLRKFVLYDGTEGKLKEDERRTDSKFSLTPLRDKLLFLKKLSKRLGESFSLTLSPLLTVIGEPFLRP